MRISDWSSDVCSSDLPYLGLPERIASGKPVGGEIGGKRAAIDPRGAERGERGGGVELFEPSAVRAANERVVAIEGRRQAEQSLEQPMNVGRRDQRSAEHTSELQSLMRISTAGFCFKKINITNHTTSHLTY